MSGVSRSEWALLRRRFLDDQAEAAVEEAAELLTMAARQDGRTVDRSGRPSGWALRLLQEARRNRCSHWPREGADLVFVPAHVRQLLCRRCAEVAAERLRSTPDGVRCDVCREVAPLEPFMLQVGSLLATGRCCAGCRPVVHGTAS